LGGGYGGSFGKTHPVFLKGSFVAGNLFLLILIDREYSSWSGRVDAGGIKIRVGAAGAKQFSGFDESN